MEVPGGSLGRVRRRKGDDPRREFNAPATRRFDQKIHENRKDSTSRGNKSVTTRAETTGPRQFRVLDRPIATAM